MMEEIWKDIPEYEGYQVSNFGNVKSEDKTIVRKNGQTVHKKGRVLKPYPNSNGYLRVCLCGNRKREFVHRLVAYAFIENPNDYPCVNHIDCNPKNNRADNLEWCTHKQNMEHSAKLGRMKISPDRARKISMSQRAPIIAQIIETGEVERYDSIKTAGQLFGSSGDICVCLNNQRLTYKGRRWYRE